MPVNHREEGSYELFETTEQHQILVLNDQKWAAWVQGQQGDLLVESDSDHQKDHTIGLGKFVMLDFEDDPDFKDMPHLFLERDGTFHEMMLPQGWPTSSDKQKKLVDTDNNLPKEKLDKYR